MKHCGAWLGCLLPLLVLSACTNASKCTRGDLGCACTSDASCSGDARCVQGLCVKKADGGGGGDGGNQSLKDSGADASTQPDASTSPDSGVDKTPIDCTVKTFDAACREYCRALCASEANFCLNSNCDPGFCGTDGGDLHSSCVSVCANNDVGCMQDLCKGELKRTCEDFGYIDMDTQFFSSGCFNEDPACVLDPDYGCSVTCGTGPNATGGQLATNGKCDDGGKGSVSSDCTRGTDCMDCGMRACAKQGESCQNGDDCCGYYPDMGAVCVDIDGDPKTDDAICLQKCTDTDCPSNTTCTALAKDAGAVCAP